MADDLNDFLRQAALRREARKKASGSPSGPGRPLGPTSESPPSKRPVSSAEELDVIHPMPVEQRHLTPQLPSGDHLAGNVAKADQKREAHLREAFGKNLEPLERKQKKKPKQPSHSKAAVATIATAGDSGSDAASEIPGTEARAEAPGNYKVMSPQDLLKLLRNPDSLKMAFIASEIFGRKFQ